MAQLEILHVEDDPDDAFFFRRALRLAHPDFNLHLEKNGEGAIKYLGEVESRQTDDSPPVPDLMLLDLKLPGLSGFDVLSWTRSRETFKALPIVILSGSSLANDRKKADELGASDFIVKNSNYDQIAGHILQFLANSRQ